MSSDSEDSIALSVKRRRLNFSQSVTTLKCQSKPVYRRKIRFLHLPNEIVLKIFKKLLFQTIVGTVQYTCVRFQKLCIDLMNLELCNIKYKIMQSRTFLQKLCDNAQNTKDKINKVYSQWTLDLVENWYNTIIASTWRYNYFMFLPGNEVLMNRAGFLLDQFNLVLQQLSDEQKLYTYRFHQRPLEITILRDCVKEFLLKFERYMCSRKGNDPFRCGSKIIDLLDCLIGCKRKIIVEHVNGSSLNLHLQYTIDRAWFIAFDTGNKKCLTNENCYDDLRYMYKRLRRIIRAHNTFILDKKLISNPIFLTVDPPLQNLCEVYCGFGEVNSTFYFYGTMNEEYLRANIFEWEDNENNNIENEDAEEEDNAARDFLFASNQTPNRPTVKIDIILNCTNIFCPLYMIRRDHASNYDLCYYFRTFSPKQTDSNDYFFMNMIIESNSGKENRLPFKYKYGIKQYEDQKFSVKRESLKSAEF